MTIPNKYALDIAKAVQTKAAIAAREHSYDAANAIRALPLEAIIASVPMAWPDDQAIAEQMAFDAFGKRERWDQIIGYVVAVKLAVFKVLAAAQQGDGK